MTQTDKHIVLHLQRMLGEKRLRHSFAVADSALALAQSYGADPQQAYTAGLAHDICKDLPGEKQLQIIQEAGILITSCERQNSRLWHAPAGEGYLRLHKLLDDPESLRAVRLHTTGAPGMSRLAQVVYLADFISADRNYADVGIVREKAARSLEEAMLYTLQYKLPMLLQREEPLEPNSVAFYNELLLAGKNREETR